MTKSKYPMAIEALAAWRGKLYKSTSRGHTYFKVVYYVGAGRKTLGFQSKDDADKGVKDLVRQLGQAEGDALVLSGNDAVHVRQAFDSLAELPERVPINIAVNCYVEMRKLLGDVLPQEAARYYKIHHGLNLPEKAVSEVVAELLTEKRQSLSDRHVKDLDSRLTRFAGDFNYNIAAITGQRVREWLNALTGTKGHGKNQKSKPLSPRSKNNYLHALQNLVSFSKEKGYLPKGWDQLNIKQIKERQKDVEIFTADEVARLLSNASEKVLPFVALSAFAGIRSAELERLDWSKVDLAEGQITIDASIAKTNSRRVIPIADNLKDWLTPIAQKKGPVCGYGNMVNALMKLAKVAKVEWKRNGLRHAFGSFRTAQTSDIPRVSFEMGNSPAMVRQHYLKLSTPKAAEAFFSVRPSLTVAA